VIKRPVAAFLFSLAAGVAMVAFSSDLAGYTQYYFITTVLVQDSFIIGLVAMFVGALTYLRPDEHTVWSLVMTSMGISELVLVTSTSSTIPFLQISLIGPAAGILALISGFLGLIFKPEIIRFSST
jgi:peptidoglycan/LPS O-acetylase OafA/YrhL